MPGGFGFPLGAVLGVAATALAISAAERGSQEAGVVWQAGDVHMLVAVR